MGRSCSCVDTREKEREKKEKNTKLLSLNLKTCCKSDVKKIEKTKQVKAVQEDEGKLSPAWVCVVGFC